MVRHKEKNLNGLAFSSLEDFKNYLINNSHIARHASDREEEGKGWSGVRNWEDFMSFMQEGDKDITKQIKKHTEVYIKYIKKDITETSYAFDVTGLFFDIGTVLAGEPEAWIQEIQVQEDKFIEINLQGAYNYATDLKTVQKNGARIFALAVALEQKGFLVKINFVFRTIGSYSLNKELATEVSFVIKNYDQMLDYKKMGILLSVPFFRRGFFRLIEIEYDNNRSRGYGQGKSKAGEINLDKTQEVDALEKILMEK